MKQMGITIGVLTAAAALAGCGGGDARGGEWEGSVDTLAGGVVRVENRGAGAWKDGRGWRLAEELRLGSADGEGPELFGDVVGVEADALGRIWVADAQANELRVFDGQGRHVRTVGRKGAGPGEFTGLAGMAWGPGGHLWVVDNGEARFTVFDTAGRMVATHRREGGLAVSPWRGGFDGQGRLYDVGLDPASREPRPVLNRFDRAMRKESAFPIPQHQGEQFVTPTPTGQLAATVPFTGYVVWALDPTGDVWVGMSDRYRLARVGFGGDTARVVARRAESAPVSDEERARAVEELGWFTDAGGRVDPARIPRTKPSLQTFWVDDQGYLWVRPNRAADEPPVFDVFDPEGRYLGAVQTPDLGPFPLIRVRGSTLYAAVRGDMDVPQVVRFRIEGR
jgi:6-bladed beta-propeller